MPISLVPSSTSAQPELESFMSRATSSAGVKDSNSGCALVLDGTRLIGIFTEHDVLLWMTAGPPSSILSNAAEVTVKELMSPNPETLQEKDSVAEALNKMSLGRYRHIPFKKSDGNYSIASIKSVL